METVDGELISQLAEHLVGNGSLARLSAPLAAELTCALAAALVEHVPFLEVLERRVVAQFWDLETEDVASFGWSFAVQRSFVAAVFTDIAAYADRFTCRLRRGSCSCLPGRFAGDSGHPQFGCCLQAFRLEATESSLQDGPFGRQGHLQPPVGCSGCFERLGDTAKAVKLLQECSVWKLRAPSAAL